MCVEKRMTPKWGLYKNERGVCVVRESYNSHIALIKQWPPGGFVHLSSPSTSKRLTHTQKIERERERDSEITIIMTLLFPIVSHVTALQMGLTYQSPL